MSPPAGNRVANTTLAPPKIGDPLSGEVYTQVRQ